MLSLEPGFDGVTSSQGNGGICDTSYQDNADIDVSHRSTVISEKYDGYIYSKYIWAILGQVAKLTSASTKFNYKFTILITNKFSLHFTIWKEIIDWHRDPG